MKKDCKFCQIVDGERKALKLYEDKKVIAVLSDTPAALGHILLMPKEHFPIIEQVPDYIVGHVFEIANKISIAVFESLGAQGTNILVNNGIAAGQESAHFLINIIPRTMNDALNFQWQTKQLSEEQISTVELQLKEQTASITGQFEKEKAEPIKAEKEAEEIKEQDDNLMVKQFERIP